MPTETPLMLFWRELNLELAKLGYKEATYGEARGFFEQGLTPAAAAPFFEQETDQED